MCSLLITEHYTAFGFNITPSEQIVPEGQVAVFTCQHTNANDIVWIVNGTSLWMHYPQDVSATSSGIPLLFKLYITAHIEYNRSSIECAATFGIGSPIQRSPVVELLIQGENYFQP